MKLATATNRRGLRPLAGPAAREDRIPPSARQLPKTHRAPPTGEVAPARDSGRGRTPHFAPQISCGADS